jgi:aldehyde dehydrogenase (NAD+)
MRDYQFYIGGKWVEPTQPKTLEVINPAMETVCGHIHSAGRRRDRAVKAAQGGLETFSQTSREKRIELSARIVADPRSATRMAKAITEDMARPFGSRSAPGRWAHAFHDCDPVLGIKFDDIAARR